MKKGWQFLSAIEVKSIRNFWSVSHARFYLKGCPNFEIVMDHLPLVKLFFGQLGEPVPEVVQDHHENCRSTTSQLPGVLASATYSATV